METIQIDSTFPRFTATIFLLVVATVYVSIFGGNPENPDFVAMDKIILIIPFAACMLSVVWTLLDRVRGIPSPGVQIVFSHLFTMLGYGAMAAAFLSLWSWNAYPDYSVFEARFTLNISVFAATLYFGSKLKLKIWDFRQLLFNMNTLPKNEEIENRTLS